jgi:hypothetical protein
VLPRANGTSRDFSGHMLKAFLHDAFRGRGLGDGEGEEGKRKGKGVFVFAGGWRGLALR